MYRSVLVVRQILVAFGLRLRQAAAFSTASCVGLVECIERCSALFTNVTFFGSQACMSESVSGQRLPLPVAVVAGRRRGHEGVDAGHQRLRQFTAA